VLGRPGAVPEEAAAADPASPFFDALSPIGAQARYNRRDDRKIDSSPAGSGRVVCNLVDSLSGS
jgi:hypothetical protein